jgi:hypothetical protein
MALAALWRRCSPLSFLVMVGVLAAVMNAYLTSLDHLPLVAAYLLLVPTYTSLLGGAVASLRSGLRSFSGTPR